MTPGSDRGTAIPPRVDNETPAGTRPSAAGASWGLWGAFSRWFVYTPWVVWTIVLVNLVNSAVGYVYWYGSEILAAPVYLWPFVPDSPLSGTLLAFALLAFHRGRRWELLGLLAVTGGIKYGLWTDWVWLTNALSGGRYTVEAVVLSANHFAMVVEGLLLLPLLRPRLWHILFVAAWYGFNDLTDYGFGRHPGVPNPEDIRVITIFAVASTAVLCALWFVRFLRSRPDRT